MHKFDDQASKVLLKVLSHTIERLSMDPPTLDYPKSVDFFEKNAPSLITKAGNSIDTVFDQYKNVLEQSIISVDSPRNLSFIPAAPTKASMIFDLVVSAGSLRGESWLESSGVVWAENQVLRWIADLVKFPKTAGGCFISGGTNGNLSALVVAREEFRKSNPDNAVVATAGTTNLGIIDDIDSIARYTKQNNFWLHVDGAYGGAGLLSPKVRKLYKGIEKANSFIVDPHKWLFAPVDCAAVIYRDQSMAAEAHSQSASYLDVLHENEEGGSPSDYAFHLSRRARGLPLWFSLSIYGVKEYRESVEHSIEIAKYAADRIQELDYLDLFIEPVLSVVVFERSGWSWEDYKIWSKQQLRNQLCFVVPSMADEKPVLRFAFLNPETSKEIVDEILLSLE
jgi:aromatic-L-amino-acid/L-tryptophan decarboxylase